MPGFKDSDENKQIVIKILHKCLLTRVERCKFIVILDVRLIYELKLTQLIDDYALAR